MLKHGYVKLVTESKDEELTNGCVELSEVPKKTDRSTWRRRC